MFLLCLASISRLLEVGSQGSFREEFVIQASLVTVKNLVETVATILNEGLEIGDELVSSWLVC